MVKLPTNSWDLSSQNNSPLCAHLPTLFQIVLERCGDTWMYFVIMQDQQRVHWKLSVEAMTAVQLP